MERDPNVVLPDSEARCVPSKACPHSHHCARAKALIPAKYASIADFTLTVIPLFGCREYRAIEWRKRK